MSECVRERERERRGGRLLKDCREKDRVLPLCRVVVVVVVVVVEFFFCFALVFPKKMLNGHLQSLERIIFGCVASSPTRSEESAEENRFHQSTGFARLRRRGDRDANDFRREMADEFV